VVPAAGWDRCRDVARAALEKDVVLAPGNAFSLSQTATEFMRFNVSQMLDPKVFAVLGEALDAASAKT
jgi:DNA-binding transcriptional MocR family regulator